MRFIADMGISPKVVDALCKDGHDAIHLWDEGLGQLPDSVILAKAREDGRILLTADLDFGQLMAGSSETLPSIVPFRLPSMKPARVTERLRVVLADCGSDLASGLFVTVTESAVRIRHLPIGRED